MNYIFNNWKKWIMDLAKAFKGNEEIKQKYSNDGLKLKNKSNPKTEEDIKNLIFR